MTISQSGSEWLITVDTGEAWIRSALATGPVVVDPTVESTGTQTCELLAEKPTRSECALSQVDVGFDATHEECHALMKLPIPSSIPSAAVILDASLHMQLKSHSTSNATAIGVYRVTRSWSSPTWETYEGTSKWTMPGGDYANPSEDSDASVLTSVGTTDGWYSWPLTKMVQEFADGADAPEYEGHREGYANDGVIVKDATDGETKNLLDFYATGASEGPYLEIAYEPRGQGSEPQYTLLSTSLTERSAMSVNAASGNLMLTSNDMEIAGVAGLGFASIRTWNSLNPETVEEYGPWSDSNYNLNHLAVRADGNLAMENTTGAWLAFIRQANKSFIPPAGMKAVMCEAGSPKPCPETLPSGTKYILTYDASGDYVDYNSEGVGSGLHDRFGNKISVTYPALGSETQTYTDTHGHKIEESKSANGFITEIKDVSGERHTKYKYSGPASLTELESYTDAAGNVTKYTYGSGGTGKPDLISKITDPAGDYTTFEYDSLRQVTEIQRYNSAKERLARIRFKYYAPGEAPGKYCESKQQATVVRDPDWTEPAKEEKGEKFVLAPHETLYCANVLDEVERTFNANGNETAATYDQYGNKLSITAPARETGAARGVTSFVYGTDGQNLGCEVQGTTGEPVKICPGGELELGYATEANYHDEAFIFQPTETISARRETTSLCYWGGTAKCAGKIEGEAGSGGALRQETEPNKSNSTAFDSYETDGNLASSTDFDGNTTHYEYEALGNLKTVIPPAGSGLGKETITVDADDRPHIIVQCLVESGGSCTSSDTETLTYNNLDQVTEAVYTGPGATKTIKYTYNADGRLEKMVDPTGTTTYTLDGLGRVTEEALPGGASNAYSYDEASNLMSFTDAGGTTHYAYNGLNELESMYEPGGTCTGTPSKCTQFAYDNDGSLTTTTYASGASMRYKLAATTGRVLTAEADGPKGETLLSNKYEYDEYSKDTPLILRDSFSGPGGVTAETDYSYDEGLYRLTEALTKSTTASYKSCYQYRYDPVGNITSEESRPSGAECEKPYTAIDDIYNTGNQLECRMIASEVKKCSKEKATEISGYTYNGAGAETAIEGYSESASTGFDYNNINQLESLTPSGKGEEKLQYLGSGQAKLVGLGTTTLQNSTLGITKQTIEGNASYYARTPGGTLIDERLPGSISYNPVYDAQGDVIGLLNSGGELVQTISYGPYGENAKATKIGEHGVEYSSTNDPLLFQGGYHTAGGNPGVGNVPNGLYHFGERYYDPTTARWTQREPGSENGDTAEQGSYVFAEDDPVNATDLTGRCPFDRNLNATIYFSHKYAYIQICKNGRQVGYEKVPLLRSSRLAGRRVTVDGEMAYELVEEGVKALRKTREVEEAFAPEDTE